MIIRESAGIKSLSCAHDHHAQCSGEAMYADGRVGHEMDLIVSPCVCHCHTDRDDERWHLVIEDDDGVPFVSGCDCDSDHDHYSP